MRWPDIRNGFGAGMPGVRLVLRFRLVLALFLVAATVLCGIRLKDLRACPDPLDSLYPEGHPYLPALEAIRKMAPEPRMLIVLLEVRGGDIYNAEALHKIDRITKDLMGIEGILPGGILSLTRGMNHYRLSSDGLSIEPILGRRWPDSPQAFQGLKRRVAVNPMGPGRYVSYDGTTAMITAALADPEQKARTGYRRLSDREKEGLPFEAYRKRVSTALASSLLEGTRAIRAREEDERHRIYFMGPQLIEAQMTSMGRRQVPLAAGLTAALLVLLLAAYTRSLLGVLFPLFVMGCSMVWALGIFVASHMPFNPMALPFPLLLGLFSLAYSVPVIREYERSYRETGDKSLSITHAFGRIRIAASILTAGLVTLGLSTVPVPMIRGLGFFGLCWLAGTIGVLLLGGPVLLSFLPGPGGRKAAASGSLSMKGPAIPPASPAGRRRRGLVLVLLLGTLGAGILAAAGLRVGENVPGYSYISPAHPWNRCFDLFSRKFMGPWQLLVYARAGERGGLLDPEAIGDLGDFSRFLREQAGARDSIALDMMVREARYTLMDGNPKWQVVPISKKQVRRLADLVVAEGGVESFVDKTFTEATISPFFPSGDARAIDRYASRMQAYIDGHPSDRVRFRLGGGLLGMTKAVNDGTRRAYHRILPLAFGLALLLGVLATGSLLLGVVILLPVLAAQASVWIVMAAVGMKISMPVVPALAAAAGFGPFFGYLFTGLSGAHGGQGEDVRGRTGVVLFTGILLFTACLPWFFIGLKFQARMLLVPALAVLFQAGWAALLLPALAARSGPGRGSTTDPPGNGSKGLRGVALVLAGVLAGLLLDGPPARALLTDKKQGQWSLIGKFKTEATFRTCSTPDNNPIPIEAWDLVSQRNLMFLEWKHDLGRVLPWLGVSYFLQGRFFYDSAWDVGPDVLKDDDTRRYYLFDNRDQINDLKWDADLFLGYLDLTGGPVFERIGRQIIVWGEMSTLRVLDNINPLDNSSLAVDLLERRWPLFMTRTTISLGDIGPFSDASIEGFYVPGAIENRNGEDIIDGSPIIPPIGRTTVKDLEDPFSLASLQQHVNQVSNDYDADRYGAKIGFVIGGLDLNFAYYRTYSDVPVPNVDVDGFPTIHLPDWNIGGDPLGWMLQGHKIDVVLTTDKVDVYGGSFNYYWGWIDTVLRGEMALFKNVPMMTGGSIGELITSLGGKIYLPPPLSSVTIGDVLSLPPAQDLVESLFGDEVLPFSSGRISHYDVLKYGIGLDRFMYIPYLSPNQFTLIFEYVGSKIMDYKDKTILQPWQGPHGQTLYWPEWSNTFIFIATTNYLSGNLTPRLVAMYEVEPKALTLIPSIHADWRTLEFEIAYMYTISDSYVGTLGMLESRDELSFRFTVNF